MGYREIILATPGLRTYHRMDGGASEASIGPDTVTMTHTNSPVSVPGLIKDRNAAKQYSGGTMYSSFTTNALSGATQGSIECWFREDSLVDWAHLFQHDNWPTSRIQPIRNANSGQITAGWRDGVGGNDYSAPSLVYKQLAVNYVCVTFNGSLLKLYVNNLSSQGAMVGFFPVGSALFSANISGSQSLAGVLDECAIYNVELPASTVAAHHAAGRKAGILQGLILPT